jgi:hypothetical protein
MAADIVKVIDHPTGQLRVLILVRGDGRFTYCWQEWLGNDWGPRSIGAGIYDSALTAETEARQREAWLKAGFH